MQKLYEKYNGRLIEDTGSYKSRDFVNFANYAKRRMSAAAKEKDIELVNFSIGHYDISGFSEATKLENMLIFLFPIAGTDLSILTDPTACGDFFYGLPMVQRIIEVDRITL